MEQTNLLGATSIGLGAIIGAGIFVLSGTGISLAGTGVLIAFIFTGILAIMVSLQVGELTSEMPEERGATYSFAYKAFGSELGFTTGILRYVGTTTSISAIALGFGSYFVSLFGINKIYTDPLSILLIIALTLINYRGIKKTAKYESFMVIFKILVLIVFVAFAILAGHWSSSHFSGFGLSDAYGIFAASVLAMFAYSGFQSIANIAPNIKGGGRTAAKAILLSTIISMVLYVAVTASLMALAPAKEYGITADPLSFALHYANAPSWLFVLVGIGALVATATASLAMIISSSKTAYQMADDGLLPERFKKRTATGDTPTFALVFSSLIGIVMLLVFSGNVYTIASISNFGSLFSYIMVSLVVIKIRKLRKANSTGTLLRNFKIKIDNGIKAPLYPYLPIASLAMVVVFFYGLPSIALKGGMIIIALSIILYYSLRELENKPIIRLKLFK